MFHSSQVLQLLIVPFVFNVHVTYQVFLPINQICWKNLVLLILFPTNYKS